MTEQWLLLSAEGLCRYQPQPKHLNVVNTAQVQQTIRLVPEQQQKIATSAFNAMPPSAVSLSRYTGFIIGRQPNIPGVRFVKGLFVEQPINRKAMRKPISLPVCCCRAEGVPKHSGPWKEYGLPVRRFSLSRSFPARGLTIESTARREASYACRPGLTLKHRSITPVTSPSRAQFPALALWDEANRLVAYNI